MSLLSLIEVTLTKYFVNVTLINDIVFSLKLKSYIICINVFRGLNTTSNNADKFSHRRRDYPRGSHDVPAQSYPSNSEPRKNKGKKHRYPNQRQPHQRQDPSKLQPSEGASAKVISEDEFEVGSVFNAGSKKQNLNHLLNFQFEPRSSRKQQGGKNRRRNVSGAKKPKYNKEQYLQAK